VRGLDRRGEQRLVRGDRLLDAVERGERLGLLRYGGGVVGLGLERRVVADLLARVPARAVHSRAFGTTAPSDCRCPPTATAPSFRNGRPGGPDPTAELTI
jgi:hypothetical protein